MSSVYDCEICRDKDDTIRELRSQLAEWENVWDTVRNEFAEDSNEDYGTYLRNVGRLDDLDPRKKERG
jgi:hypothetical protein